MRTTLVLVLSALGAVVVGCGEGPLSTHSTIAGSTAAGATGESDIAPNQPAAAGPSGVGGEQIASPVDPAPGPAPASAVGANVIKPLALVYRGSATCDVEDEGCAPAWADMFKQCQPTFDVKYVGPDDAEDVTADALSRAGVFIYPGGNDSLEDDWAYVADYRPAIRDFVQNGGRYLGSCTGGYLAGMNPWAGSDIGFGLLPGNAGEYVGSRGADIRTTRDTLVDVVWSGVWGPSPHPIYLQDGAFFEASNGAAPGVQVLATYAANGALAALVAPFGKGKVGVEGPHAEAPQDWYDAADIDGKPDFKPGCDLIARTLAP